MKAQKVPAHYLNVEIPPELFDLSTSFGGSPEKVAEGILKWFCYPLRKKKLTGELKCNTPRKYAKSKSSKQNGGDSLYGESIRKKDKILCPKTRIGSWRGN